MNAVAKTDLLDMLDKARQLAIAGGLPARRKDAALYALLGQCAAVCAAVQAENREDELREIFRVSVNVRGKDNRGSGRRYAEAGSDVFILVARYVMSDTETTAGRSRYASALREAARRHIAPDELPAWLAENGGVNTLFRGRKTVSSDVTVRTLHLNSAATLPRRGRATLTLEMDHRGFFNVIEVRNG